MDLDCCFITETAPELVVPKTHQELYLEKERTLQREREYHVQAIERLQLNEAEDDPTLSDKEIIARRKKQATYMNVFFELERSARALALQTTLQKSLRENLPKCNVQAGNKEKRRPSLGPLPENSIDQQEFARISLSVKAQLAKELTLKLRTASKQQTETLKEEYDVLCKRSTDNLKKFENGLNLQRHEAQTLIRSRVLQGHNIKKQIDVLDNEEDESMKSNMPIPYVSRDRLAGLKEKLQNVEKDIALRRKKLQEEEEKNAAAIEAKFKLLTEENEEVKIQLREAERTYQHILLRIYCAERDGLLELPQESATSLRAELEELKVSIPSLEESACSLASLSEVNIRNLNDGFGLNASFASARTDAGSEITDPHRRTTNRPLDDSLNESVASGETTLQLAAMTSEQKRVLGIELMLNFCRALRAQQCRAMSAVLDAKFSRRRRRSLQILSIASARSLKDTEDEVHCAHNFKCSMFQVKNTSALLAEAYNNTRVLGSAFGLVALVKDLAEFCLGLETDEGSAPLLANIKMGDVSLTPASQRTNESSGLAGKILTAATESSGKQNSLEDLL